MDFSPQSIYPESPVAGPVPKPRRSTPLPMPLPLPLPGASSDTPSSPSSAHNASPGPGPATVAARSQYLSPHYTPVDDEQSPLTDSPAAEKRSSDGMIDRIGASFAGVLASVWGGGGSSGSRSRQTSSESNSPGVSDDSGRKGP